MITIKKSSIFPAAKEEVYNKLLKLETLQYIAYPYATFKPINGETELIWQENSSSTFSFRLFGIIPFGIHNKSYTVWIREWNSYQRNKYICACLES